jgi:hypothetical protein
MKKMNLEELMANGGEQAKVAKALQRLFRLRSIDTEEVSFVDRGANRRKFLVVKRDGSEAEMKLTLSGSVKESLLKSLVGLRGRLVAGLNVCRGAVVAEKAVEMPVLLSKEFRAVGGSLKILVGAKSKAEGGEEPPVEEPDQEALAEESSKALSLSGALKDGMVQLLTQCQDRLGGVLEAVKAATVDEAVKEVPEELKNELMVIGQKLVGEAAEGKPAAAEEEKVGETDPVDGDLQEADKAEAPSLVVQTLIFSKEKFPTAEDAKAWAKAHEFSDAKVDEKPDSWRLRQKEPGLFEDKSFRTFPIPQDDPKSGVKAVGGRLKKAEEPKPTTEAEPTEKRGAKMSKERKARVEQALKLLAGVLKEVDVEKGFSDILAQVRSPKDPEFPNAGSGHQPDLSVMGTSADLTKVPGLIDMLKGLVDVKVDALRKELEAKDGVVASLSKTVEAQAQKIMKMEIAVPTPQGDGDPVDVQKRGGDGKVRWPQDLNARRE